ncbi:hypothetical protein RND71_034433 [Anisodus tanguticus]|uniref:Uncharacterized protein n=1 Tax=Anisodus tanguticus TaxID=243964 RepID=A0AAE1RBA6_9SOLA|nr:hypothetical protein RND71_034433 [Anisodus tanguticus]
MAIKALKKAAQMPQVMAVNGELISQEAYRQSNNWLPPAWAIVAMIILVSVVTEILCPSSFFLLYIYWGKLYGYRWTFRSSSGMALGKDSSRWRLLRHNITFNNVLFQVGLTGNKTEHFQKTKRVFAVGCSLICFKDVLQHVEYYVPLCAYFPSPFKRTRDVILCEFTEFNFPFLQLAGLISVSSRFLPTVMDLLRRLAAEAHGISRTTQHVASQSFRSK